jgi:hypothetical protein
MSQIKKKLRELQDFLREEEQTETNTIPEISIHTNASPPILKPIIKEDDRRMSPRHRIEFETVVFCAGVSFRTNDSLCGPSARVLSVQRQKLGSSAAFTAFNFYANTRGAKKKARAAFRNASSNSIV